MMARSKGASVATTALNVFKVYTGTGLIAFPYATRCGGLCAAPLGLVLIGFLNNYSIRILVDCKRRVAASSTGAGVITFTDVAARALGPVGRKVCAASVVVSLLGICIAYLIFIGETVQSAVGLSAEECHADGDARKEHWSCAMVPRFGSVVVNMWVLIACPCCCLLSMLRSMASLSWTSLAGNLALISVIIVSLVYAGRRIHTHGGAGTASDNAWPYEHVPLFNASTFPVFFGLTVFAFAIQSVILSMEDAAGPRAKERFLRICDVAGVGAVICYSVFGVVCYAAYGEHTHAIVLLSLPDTGIVAAVKLAVSLAILFTFPIQMMPVIEMSERYLQKRRAKSNNVDGHFFAGEGAGEVLLGSVADSDLAAIPYRRPTELGDNIEDAVGGDNSDVGGGNGGDVGLFSWRVRVSLVLACVVAALLFGEVFSQVLGLVGSLGLSLVSFVLPPLCFTKLSGGFAKLSPTDRVGVAVVLVVGAAGIIASAVVEVGQLVAYFEGREDECAVAQPSTKKLVPDGSV